MDLDTDGSHELQPRRASEPRQAALDLDAEGFHEAHEELQDAYEPRQLRHQHSWALGGQSPREAVGSLQVPPRSAINLLGWCAGACTAANRASLVCACCAARMRRAADQPMGGGRCGAATTWASWERCQPRRSWQRRGARRRRSC